MAIPSALAFANPQATHSNNESNLTEAASSDLAVVVRPLYPLIETTYHAKASGAGLVLHHAIERVAATVDDKINPIYDKIRGPKKIEKIVGDYFGEGCAREAALDRCASDDKTKKIIRRYCRDLLSFTKAKSNSAETQLVAFKIIVILVTRYPGIRPLFYGPKPDASMLNTGLWNRPESDECDESWRFYNQLAVYCLQETKLSQLIENRKLSEFTKLTRIEEDGSLLKEGLEELLFFCSADAEWNNEKICATRYLAALLELPTFWELPKPDNTGMTERVSGFLSNLCDRIFEMLGDTMPDSEEEGKASVCMSVMRYAVDHLAHAIFKGFMSFQKEQEGRSSPHTQRYPHNLLKAAGLLKRPNMRDYFPMSAPDAKGFVAQPEPEPEPAPAPEPEVGVEVQTAPQFAPDPNRLSPTVQGYPRGNTENPIEGPEEATHEGGMASEISLRPTTEEITAMSPHTMPNNNENSTTTSRRKSYILTRLSVADPKPFESVQVLVNSSAVETEWQRSHDDGAHRASTDLSSALGRPISLFSLRLYFERDPKKLFMKHEADILVDIQKHLWMVDIKEGETQISKNYKKTVITITVQLSPAPSSSSIATHEGAMASESSLRPTTERITAVCPRFRILVIGNSGVGKSTLINMIFGLSDNEETAAKISDLRVGEADIEREIKPRENVRLVLHHSRGFEEGETDNAETVTRFIQSRRDKPNLQDKLHAVWLCIQIPIRGGAVVEAGVESLLKKKASGELGDVPFIVVFTQYDRLISQVRYELRIQVNAGGTKLNDEDMKSKVFKWSEELFTTNCLKPFQNKAQDTFPYVKVSTRAGYEDTVHELVKLTATKLEGTLSLELYINSVMTWRFGSDVKIQRSINVGNKRYWNILFQGTIFKEKNFKVRLDVIHEDIVGVWNFYDPRYLLRNSEFKLLMNHMAHNLSQEQPTSVSPIKTFFMGIASDDTIRRFMAYVADLTIVMQNLFWIVEAKKDQGPITIHMIEFAYRAYMGSINRARVHIDIDDFVNQTNPLDRANRGKMKGKVEELLQKYGINGEPDMKKSLEAVDLKALDYVDGGGPQRWSMIEDL